MAQIYNDVSAWLHDVKGIRGQWARQVPEPEVHEWIDSGELHIVQGQTEPGVRLTPEQGNAGEFRVVSSEVVPMTDGSGRLRMYFESCPGTQSTENSIRSALSEDGGLTWKLAAGIDRGICSHLLR